MTVRARAILVAAMISLVVAAGLSAWTATAASGLVLLLVSLAYAATLPISRQLRAQSIELAWWIDTEGGTRRNRVVAKSPFGLRLFVRHLGENPIRITRFEILASGVHALDDAEAIQFVLPGRARVDTSLRCVCPAPGRAVLHGARVDVAGPFGLFETRLYFPNRLRLAVTPVHASIGSSVQTPADPRSMPRASATKRRDEGTDLHELRDLQPGDPYRRIAWKTSARVGRLVVRELERDELGAVEIVLDAGPSMRDGPLGDRKLDRAVSLALGIAEDSLRRGERVGIVTADRRVLRRVDADSRPDQRERILDALLASIGCVDADRTVEDDRSVGRAVARYVRFQEGVDFFDPLAVDGVHLERLSLYVANRARGFHEVNAPTQTGRILRKYAELVGIPIQHRTDRDVEARSTGLGLALRAIEPRRVAPSRVVLVTDGVDVDLAGRLRASTLQLRRHGHAVEIVLVARPLPFPPASEGSVVATTFLEDDLARLRSVATSARALGLGVRIDSNLPKRRDAA